MGALTCNRYKRHVDSQFQSPHASKKLKPSDSASMVSRLSLYPQQVTPITREIQAPCIVVTGFNSTVKRSGTMDDLLKNYNRTKKVAKGSCRYVNFEAVNEVVEVTDDDNNINENENNENDASGDSDVEEIRAKYRELDGKVEEENLNLGFQPCSSSGVVSDTMDDLLNNYNRTKDVAKGSCRYVMFEMVDEVVEFTDDDKNNIDENDASGDSVAEEIREKYRELDAKVEEEDLNLGFQPFSSSEVVSDIMGGKRLESLSLDPRPDVLVDAGLPYHKKLLDSALKRDSRLSRLSFDIKFQEEKRALLKQLTPAKKDESKKDEDKLLEPFRPLTEDDKEMVANALSNSSRRKVLVTHDNSNITITGEVLRCLSPGAWLNDEVINVYLELLKEREKKEPKKFLKCHFFNTFFYKKLISGKMGYDYKSVRRWTTQKKLGYSLLECDKIFIPVHKEIHWCLAVINKKEEKFQYLDSLGGNDKQVMRVLAKYFVDEVKDKHGEDIDVTSWQQEYVTDLPNQKNGFDCGVFMIKYADFYSRDIGLCFNQEHMPYFRSRTAMEILKLKAD